MPETTVNKWDDERLAEARSVASGFAEVENTDSPVGKETFRFVAFFSGASVLSLLDALEEARRERGVLADAGEGWRNAVKAAEEAASAARRGAEEARARADSLVAWLSKDLKGHRLCRACNALDGHMTWCEVPKYEADA